MHISGKAWKSAPPPFGVEFEHTPLKSYEERLEEAHAHAERMIMTLLYSWETQDFPVPEGRDDFDNMNFWRNMKDFPYLKRIAALFAGRPPSQVEDE